MLLIFLACIELDYSIAPNILFSDCFDTTLMILKTVVHYYIGSV